MTPPNAGTHTHIHLTHGTQANFLENILIFAMAKLCSFSPRLPSHTGATREACVEFVAAIYVFASQQLNWQLKPGWESATAKIKERSVLSEIPQLILGKP